MKCRERLELNVAPVMAVEELALVLAGELWRVRASAWLAGQPIWPSRVHSM